VASDVARGSAPWSVAPTLGAMIHGAEVTFITRPLFLAEPYSVFLYLLFLPSYVATFRILRFWP
jgi:hypothetical protein